MLTVPSMAGADSTATAMRTIFLYIITNPSVYSKLRDEIFAGLEDGRISSPVIRDAEARDLPYLQACIKEGLRIWPPLTGLMTKKAPPEGDHFKGLFIPSNTDIAYSAWGVQRNTETYGEDADMFRPERWLETKRDALHKMERSQELVFGSGRYGCLGKSVAFVELNKVFVQVRRGEHSKSFMKLTPHQLLRNFDFAVLKPIAPMKTRCNGIYLQKDMFVRVTERVQS
jgi:cytochrome P450